MNIRELLAPTVLLAVIFPLAAQTTTRRAAITGDRGPGSCTITVSVDHSAQVEVRGDTAQLTTLAGQAASWRDFRCNVPLPDQPRDFRLERINGRGRVTLLKEPRRNRGAAVIHIIDPQGGRATYAINVVWRDSDRGLGSEPSFPGAGNAVQSCQEAVIDRLNRKGYEYVRLGRSFPENNPGQNDLIRGVATGKRRGKTRSFSFSCAVDLRSGRVRSVDVHSR